MTRPTLVKPHMQSNLFDARPIELPGFTLRHRAAVPSVDKPTIRQWQTAMEYASETAENSPYWVGDLLAYSDSRADWHEKMSQALTVTKLSRQTLHNYTRIARRVAVPERELSPSVAHSAVIAKLTDVGAQREWLTRANEEGWDAAEFSREVGRHRPILSGTAPLDGMFKVWYIDCPWRYGDKPPSGSGASTHYPTISIEQLCGMGAAVKAHTTPDAISFWWVTAPLLYETPGPREVIAAWGFEPKTGIVWDKVRHNFGHYVSVRHEHLILATRGSCTPDRPTPMPDSVVTVRHEGEHSEKPEEFRRLIMGLYDGPYVEMFARRQVEGWTCYGNQIMGDVRASA